jgi:carbamate kinase
VKIVIAIDGELLVPQDMTLGIQGQRKAAANIVSRLGGLIEAGHRMVITHGNGPQVGNILFRAEVASHAVHTVPLDVCGADTQGATGYLLEQALRNWLYQAEIQKDVAALVTQVVVEKPNIDTPTTKGVGPFFDLNRARAYENNRSWKFAMVPGYGYQRVVPALVPYRVIEARTIRTLLELGLIVICAGGGGIPVWVDAQGRHVGVEAVVDKAYTAVLLAQEVKAETIVFVSPVPRIERAFTDSVLNGVACLPRSAIAELLEQRSDLEDSIRAKLIASQEFFQCGGQSVLLVSPEQLDIISPRLSWGVRLVADEIVSE